MRESMDQNQNGLQYTQSSKWPSLFRSQQLIKPTNMYLTFTLFQALCYLRLGNIRSKSPRGPDAHPDMLIWRCIECTCPRSTEEGHWTQCWFGGCWKGRTGNSVQLSESKSGSNKAELPKQYNWAIKLLDQRVRETGWVCCFCHLLGMQFCKR